MRLANRRYLNPTSDFNITFPSGHDPVAGNVHPLLKSSNDDQLSESFLCGFCGFRIHLDPLEVVNTVTLLKSALLWNSALLLLTQKPPSFVD